MSIPKDKILPISLNSRYVLAAFGIDGGEPSKAALQLILPSSMKESIANHPDFASFGYRFKPSFKGETADNVPLLVNFSVASKFNFGSDVLENWRNASLAERDHWNSSRFRKSHEIVVYRAATDLEYRRLLLDRAFTSR